jgi:hypothetical protein
MGRDSASSAQSKRVGRGETARLGPSWGALGQKGGEQDAGGEQGVLAGADVDVGDAGGVYHTDVGETACFGGFWGKLGGWDKARGCSEGSSSLFRCFSAAVRGPEWARAEE